MWGTIRVGMYAFSINLYIISYILFQSLTLQREDYTIYRYMYKIIFKLNLNF